MNRAKLSLWLSVAALTLAIALVADRLVVAWLPDGTLLRGLLLVSNCVLAGVALTLSAGRGKQRQAAAQRHLEILCRLDQHALMNDARLAELPPVPLDNPWHEVTMRVRDALRKQAARLQDLEQTRSANEVRLRRNEARMERIQAILAGISDPVLAIDAFDDLVLANPVAEELFQFDLAPGSAEQRALKHLVRCEQLVELLVETRRRRTLTQRSMEIEIAEPGGSARWYNVTTRNIPLRDDAPAETGESHGAVAVLRDISAQRAIQQRNAEFVSAVSHEMKTPLAGIKAYVELLLDGDADDEATRGEFLGVVSNQANRLQRLVDNLLNLARIEAGVVSVSKRAQSLNDLLEEAFRLVEPSAAAKRITLEHELSSMYLGILADRDMLLQAAINLLSNAIKYTPDGGQVTLRSRLLGDEVRFEVVDNGVGLTPEDCHKVFQKFYRVEKNKRMATGTGLGLPLAKHIIEDVHGGRLTVESTLGVGSTFAVTMPCAGRIG